MHPEITKRGCETHRVLSAKDDMAVPPGAKDELDDAERRLIVVFDELVVVRTVAKEMVVREEDARRFERKSIVRV